MRTWMFRPFDRVAGGLAMMLGLAVLAVTGFLAWHAGVHTDGVLDLHFGPPVAPWVLLAQGLVNWLALAGMLLVTGKWLGSGRFRLIDLFGTQALARWPMFIGVAWLSVPWVGGEIEARTANLMAVMPDQPGEVIAPLGYLFDAMWLLVLSLPVLAAMVWMVWLMYHGYALVTNLRGQRAVFSFIAALIAAEILSKVLIHFLLQAAI